jgi:hypothetical protein
MRDSRIRVTFERVVTVVTVANFAVWVVSLLDNGHEPAYAAVETGCLVFFAVEMVVRLREHGWRFFRSGWNAFDFCVVGLALLPALGVDVALLRVARLARLFHLARHGHILSLRMLRVARDAVR